MKLKSILFDKIAIERAIKRISHEIVEKNTNVSEICIIGIKTRGVPLAQRIAAYISANENVHLPIGVLDITLYRDDLSMVNGDDAIVNASEINFDTTGKVLVFIDDVIYTGRTTRAALDALRSYGRPKRIQLAVLVDRGHRELPIRPDFVGKNIPTSISEIIRVNLSETDGLDSIELYKS